MVVDPLPPLLSSPSPFSAFHIHPLHSFPPSTPPFASSLLYSHPFFFILHCREFLCELELYGESPERVGQCFLKFVSTYSDYHICIHMYTRIPSIEYHSTCTCIIIVIYVYNAHCLVNFYGASRIMNSWYIHVHVYTHA